MVRFKVQPAIVKLSLSRNWRRNTKGENGKIKKGEASGERKKTR